MHYTAISGACSASGESECRPPWRELPSTLRRRTPGLRREELGGLAGVSADYIKRLEQGRARPSMAVLDALSRALRLSRAEYEHLCRLAGYAPAGEGCVPTHLGPGARRLLDRLDTGPVGIFTAAWTQLAANSSWAMLFYDPNAQRGHERNLVWREFLGFNDCVIDPEENKRFRASLVADLRAAVTRYPADRELTALIADLRSASTCFVQAWDATPPTTQSAPHAVIMHPQIGPIHMDYDILTIHHGDLRVALFTAEPDSDDAQRLALAHVIGLQDLSATEPHQL
ncbi:helix-turn-helix domain-containing protein [Nocardia sp. NPDC056000]|uniref:helix-turn-helix domain-containing protein n=1 Tax=Nocardia sp. NPDC056000 TaxID=3345674 RepID=UPI0035DFD6FD